MVSVNIVRSDVDTVGIELISECYAKGHYRNFVALAELFAQISGTVACDNNIRSQKNTFLILNYFLIL